MMRLLRTLAARAKFLLLLSVDALLLFIRPNTTDQSGALIVRLDAIGDFVLWLDAAQLLVRRYKSQGRRTILVGNATWASWATELNLFDQVIAVDTREYQRNPFYRFRVGLSIRSLGCTWAIQPTYSRFWLLGDSIIRICGATERIGSAGDLTHCAPWQLKIANRWYTQLLPADPAQMTELERNAEFLRGLGEPNVLVRLPTIDLAGTNRADADLLKQINGRPYYIIFPGAGWRPREWPMANFCEIAAKLHAHTGWLGLVCGGPSDVVLAGAIVEKSAADLLNCAGRTGLGELAAILSQARLLVGNETSAAHMAAVAGVPTVCIVGGGHYGRFLPYRLDARDCRPLPSVVSHQMACFGCNWRCIYERTSGSPVPCIDLVGVAEVWQHTRDMLGLA